MVGVVSFASLIICGRVWRVSLPWGIVRICIPQDPTLRLDWRSLWRAGRVRGFVNTHSRGPGLSVGMLWDIASQYYVRRERWVHWPLSWSMTWAAYVNVLSLAPVAGSTGRNR